jgi:outer membrane receptor protein involved in Fe transport
MSSGVYRVPLRAALPFVFLSVLPGLPEAQEVLPEIVVQAQRPAPPRPVAAPTAQPKNDLASTNTKFDVARDNLSPRFGASSFDMNRAFIETLPQGTDAPINSVLLQAPGVAADSAVNGDIHVRNEHANVQYRINGIILPDGISGFGHVLDTSFVGSLALITGALPAQFGLRTAGIVDIQTKSGNSLQPGGNVGIYAGSFGTLTPSFDYGGRSGNTEYFVTGRGFTGNLGIENPTSDYSDYNAIHDRTYQGNFFSYTSTVLDPQTRVSTIFGNTTNTFQIPNNPGQMPAFTAFGVSNFDSSMLNEHQAEQNTFGVLALQKSVNGLDFQLAAFSRYSTLHFVPDTTGDLVFNGIASDVYRRGFANGLQGDGAYKLNDAHTLRAGFTVDGESTQNSNISTVLPLVGGVPVDAPFTVTDNSSKLGWIAGVYAQDEWKITNQLTVNLGLRFDQMWQYVDANQLSPRVNVVYKPLDGTTLHAGYARYFTPPPQAIAAPANIAPFANTTAQPETFQQSPVLPERAHYFDAGIVQRITPQLEVGLDAYYKISRDLLDDGQFGAALILSGFNYEKAYNSGVELSANYKDRSFSAYGNLAWARQIATNVVSNQYLFGADELAYIASNYINTDHAQQWTGSAGASYLWRDTRFSASMVYGSGLRSGFANTDHVAPYATANIGISHEIKQPDGKPVTVRFDVVNVFDTIYELRDGSGIGVFAPQYGERRGYFVGVSKRL